MGGALAWLAAKAPTGRMADEIVGVTVEPKRRRSSSRPTRRSVPTRRSRFSQKLRPVGSPRSSHTAGNSPGVNDGAGAVVAASEDWARQRGPHPRGDGALVRNRGRRLPVPSAHAAKAAKQALDKIGKDPDDVDLWEINEAFASVAINSVRMLGVDEDKVNVNGGAIALGHPIGASGARIVGALIHELRRRGGGLGCAAICSGGGQGDAIVLEVNGA